MQKNPLTSLGLCKQLELLSLTGYDIMIPNIALLHFGCFTQRESKEISYAGNHEKHLYIIKP